MRRRDAIPAVLMALILATASFALAQKQPDRHIQLPTLEDKIRGGWAGQMIGVSYGAPTEFKSNAKINNGEIQW